MMQNLSMRDLSDTIVAYMHGGKSEAECAAWLEARGWSKPAAAQFVAGIGRQMSFARKQRKAPPAARPSAALWIAALAAVAAAVFSSIAAHAGRF